MSQIIEINKKSYEKLEIYDEKKDGGNKPLYKKTEIKFDNSLLISDLDSFFKGIYDYYYNRGYSNIRMQTILDNLSYLFSIHFIILNVYIIDWQRIIRLCYVNNECNLEIMDFISFNFYDNNFFSFVVLYAILFSYYILFFWKSSLFIYKMRKMKHIYDHKLRIKQKEMENMKFSEIMERLIELQKSENFCRVKENLSRFDIIARISRKDNYMNGLISNNVIDFGIKFPLLGERNFFSNYLYNNIHACILNFAFEKGEVHINQKLYNMRYLQVKLFIFMIFEILFVPSIIIFKIIFWISKNADNIKSNRNFTQKIWSSYIQVLFKNYNELQHHFENRVNSSYGLVESFVNCFKDRMINIISKFLIIISGSFLVLIFVISSIDNRLLTDLKLMGKQFFWITVVIGILLSVLRGKEANFGSGKYFNSEENYLENVELKEKLYKKIVNKVINIPATMRKAQNYSSIFKQISHSYEPAVISLLKEILSILFFPYIWLRMIFDVKKIIRFFTTYSKSVEGLGTIYSYSYMDINNFKCLREKDFNISEYSFNDRKFINSFIWYNANFNPEAAEEVLEKSEGEFDGGVDINYFLNGEDQDIVEQANHIEKQIYAIYKKVKFLYEQKYFIFFRILQFQQNNRRTIQN